ncbi:MAG: cytochrome c [Planctomycetales bacterium]
MAPLAVIALALAGGCAPDMADQPREDPLERSAFFADGLSARPQVAGTIPRGHLMADEGFATGRRGGELVREFPVAVDRALLERGRQRFDIFCSACHDRTGHGQGMVVRRGFPRPPSYHTDRLRDAPPGHFFDVMTHGFGRMPSYASQVPPADRWAIAAYVKALQLSQHVAVSQLTDAEQERLDGQNQ